MLRRTSQPAIPAQSEYEPPLAIRTRGKHFFGFGPADEIEPLPVALRGDALHISKWVFNNQLAPLRSPEELLGNAAAPLYSIFPQLHVDRLAIPRFGVFGQPNPPRIGVAGCDFG